MSEQLSVEERECGSTRRPAAGCRGCGSKEAVARGVAAGEVAVTLDAVHLLKAYYGARR